MPYLQDIARGTGDRLPADSLLYRASLARTFNRVMGTTRFDAWNLDQIPVDDIDELKQSLDWLDELK